LRVLFGIGNPGPEYDGTRHNLGFALGDRFAADSYTSLPGFAAEAARTELAGEPLLVVRPLTYVNRCGPVLAELLRLCGLDASRALVAVDDLDLPVGAVRLRAKGSAGGHNGLRSIETSLGTDRFPRLRLGIGGEAARAHPDYVLGRFAGEELSRVGEALDRAVSAVRLWGARGIEAAMERVNRRLLDPDPARP
jgi:PTH1 family peptidyl-tRNA hydrolase